MKRKINIEVLFQLIILLGCAAFLAIALISGNIKNYVHPRFILYLWISVAALIVIGIFIFPSLFKSKHAVHLTPYVILLIPMMTAFTLPANAVNNQSISFGNKTAQEVTTSSIEKTQSETSAVTEQPITTEPAKAEVTTAFSGSFSGDIQIISDDEYMNWYIDCYDNPQKYDGKTVQFKGKIFNFDEAAENEFLPARPCMVCCAADTVPYGFLCRSDEIKSYKENDWIIVTATIKVEDYKGETMPVLYASSLSAATPPEDEYVYYNY